MSCWFRSARGLAARRPTMRGLTVLFTLVVFASTAGRAAAADGGTVTGTVTDPLGGAVSDASVVLMRAGHVKLDGLCASR